MASPFLPSVLISQDLSGTPLTATDNSNYASNTDGVTDNNIATRVINVLDENDNVIGGPFNMAKDTPITFPITKDGFFRFNLVFTSTAPVVYTGNTKYLSVQYYKNTQKNIAPQLRCSCPANENLLKFMSRARELYEAAMNSFITGDDVSAALNITDCNTYINKAAKC